MGEAPKDELHLPHDNLFSAAFGIATNAAAFLEANLPSAVSQAVVWSELLSDPQTRTAAMTLAQKLRQEGRQEDLLEALQLRFEHVHEGLADAVRQVMDDAKLRELLRTAICCGSLESFAQEL